MIFIKIHHNSMQYFIVWMYKVYLFELIWILLQHMRYRILKTKTIISVSPRCSARRVPLCRTEKHSHSNWLAVRYYRVVKNSISFHSERLRLLALQCMRKHRETVDGFWHVFSDTHLKDSIILIFVVFQIKQMFLFLPKIF